ncbi:MAG: recombinase family protein [Ktedonobacterales bacterium]
MSEFTGQFAGIYPRVSTSAQAKKGKVSQADQERACRVYAADLGMKVVEECVRAEAYTSTVMQRPELNQLLAEMKTRQVRNLIIDRADRLTRSGIIDAFTFLKQFIAAKITLHVVSMDLIVNTDKGAKDFLDAAYQAQQDNLARVRNVRRAKRSHALAGRFMRGNHAPYGHRYVPAVWNDDGAVTDWKLEPDQRSYQERGFLSLFAPTPYDARKEIIRLYATEGWTYQQIATHLNDADVPTASRLLHRTGPRGVWWEATVRRIIDDPLNEGHLINFRTVIELDPDDEEKKHQTTIGALPVYVKPAHGTPDPIVTEQTVNLIALRKVANKARHIAHATYTGSTLLGGSGAKCKLCGATLRVRGCTIRGRIYRYYTCHLHEHLPSACPGITFNVQLVDPGAWYELCYALENFGGYDPQTGQQDHEAYVDDLANQPAQRYLADALASQPGANDFLAARIAARDGFQAEVDNLAIAIGREPDGFARDVLVRRLRQLEPDIAKANQQIAAAQQQATRVAERHALLTDFLTQLHVYDDLLWALDPDEAEDIPIMAQILRAVGAVFTIGKDERGAPDIAVELTLTPLAALPWFTQEEFARLLDARRHRRYIYSDQTTPTQENPAAHLPTKNIVHGEGWANLE